MIHHLTSQLSNDKAQKQTDFNDSNIHNDSGPTDINSNLDISFRFSPIPRPTSPSFEPRRWTALAPSTTAPRSGGSGSPQHVAMDAHQQEPAGQTAKQPVEKEAKGEETHRNSKRKASDAASLGEEPGKGGDIDLLEKALAAVTTDDIRQWTGWCELESEPAFFNILLSEFGVKHTKVQEIITFDDEELASLPQPVYGIIFLYQYFEETYEACDHDDDQDVWFANQTTDNACATLAMMNIVMNCPEISLHPELQSFKDSTRNLNSALRGHALDTNEHLRTAHNGLARRLDHLNADLLVNIKAESWKKAQKRRRIKNSSSSKANSGAGTRKQPTRKKVRFNEESTFHFIAFVQANGSLWELDGLKPKPVHLQDVPEGQDLVATAAPFIQGRIMQFGDQNVYFNMMALCRSPASTAAGRIASSVREFETLKARMGDMVTWVGGEHLVRTKEQPPQATGTEELAAGKQRQLNVERDTEKTQKPLCLPKPPLAIHGSEILEVLHHYGVHQRDISTAPLSPAFTARLDQVNKLLNQDSVDDKGKQPAVHGGGGGGGSSGHTAPDPYPLTRELRSLLDAMISDIITEQKQAMDEHGGETAGKSEDESRVQGRKKDNMLMIHRWLEAIAEHGKLEEFIET